MKKKVRQLRGDNFKLQLNIGWRRDLHFMECLFIFRKDAKINTFNEASVNYTFEARNHWQLEKELYDKNDYNKLPPETFDYLRKLLIKNDAAFTYIANAVKDIFLEASTKRNTDTTRAIIKQKLINLTSKFNFVADCDIRFSSTSVGCWFTRSE